MILHPKIASILPLIFILACDIYQHFCRYSCDIEGSGFKIGGNLGHTAFIPDNQRYFSYRFDSKYDVNGKTIEKILDILSSDRCWLVATQGYISGEYYFDYVENRFGRPQQVRVVRPNLVRIAGFADKGEFEKAFEDTDFNKLPICFENGEHFKLHSGQ